jgi:hypothetical protein
MTNSDDRELAGHARLSELFVILEVAGMTGPLPYQQSLQHIPAMVLLRRRASLTREEIPWITDDRSGS